MLRSSAGASSGTPSTEAFLVDVKSNHDGAETCCLLARLRFITGAETWPMGCRQAVPGKHAACAGRAPTHCKVPSPTDASFATYCHCCPTEARGLPVVTRQMQTGAALKLMNTQWEGAPDEWWKLLPLKLTEYEVCRHVTNMLQDVTTTRSKFLKLWDPATKRYETIPEQPPAKPAPRESRGTRATATGPMCSKAGCRWQPKSNRAKTDKNNKFTGGLCPTCYRHKMAADLRLKRQHEKEEKEEEQQQQRQQVSTPLDTVRTALESSPLSCHWHKSLGGCAGFKKIHSSSIHHSFTNRDIERYENRTDSSIVSISPPPHA